MDLPVDLQTSSAAFTPTVAQFELPGRCGTPVGTDDVRQFVPRRFPARVSDTLATANDISCDDAVSEHVKAQNAKRLVQQQVWAATNARVRELHIDAALSSEAFSNASHADMVSFLRGLTLTQRPSIFLLDNGNLRALWRNGAGEQVGLQFMGGGLVQYVMFARRPNSDRLLRHYGQDVVSEIRRKITSNGCDHLIG
jgi:hypothetical protein